MDKVLYFSTEDCGPCKTLKPIVQEVASEMNINVEYLDAKTAEETKTFMVTGVPTLIIFKNGQPVKRHVGLATKQQIQLLFK
jgi:thioredoxin 1